MNLIDAVDVFVKLAVEIKPGQLAAFHNAISSKNPSDPGLLELTGQLNRWRVSNQTNPSIMILSSRINNLETLAKLIYSKSRMPKPDYNSIKVAIQNIINEMELLFNQQLRWSRQNVPIVNWMMDKTEYILRFSIMAAAAEAETPSAPPEVTPVETPTA